MVTINPIVLSGVWNQGYALDRHILSSIYIGEDEFGHPRYDNQRSDIGELVYKLKYRGENTISSIMELVIPFLKDWGITNEIELIVPVPPSKQRISQPVFEICNAIGKSLNVHVALNALKKIKNQQVKGLDITEKQDAIENSMVLNGRMNRQISLLLVDDLFQSGATLTTAANLLRGDPNVKNIYVLTMTKTKN